MRRTIRAPLLLWRWSNLRMKVGLSLLIVAVLASVVALLVRKYPPNTPGVGVVLSQPSGQFWLGTDNLGRDEFARVFVGVGLSLEVGAIVAGIALAIGVPLGVLIGYRSGVVDAVVSRILDVIFAFPSLLLALVLVTILGSGLNTAVLALVIVYVPIVTRFTRGATLAERERDYIAASRICGAGFIRIAAKGILPNLASGLLVLASSIFSFAILAEAALSYLGLGAQPPTATLGKLLADDQGFVTSAPYLVIFPAIAISYLVLALNILGDGLRDRLDPRLNQKGSALSAAAAVIP